MVIKPRNSQRKAKLETGEAALKTPQRSLPPAFLILIQSPSSEGGLNAGTHFCVCVMYSGMGECACAVW
jgi:hypothetical protein